MMPGGAAGMTIKFVACWGLSGGAFQWGAGGGVWGGVPSAEGVLPAGRRSRRQQRCQPHRERARKMSC